MPNLDVGNHPHQCTLEPGVAPSRVGLLSGLVVLAAKDDQILPFSRLNAEIAIGVVGIPEQRVRHCATGHRGGNDVTRVEREFRLEERRRREILHSDKRVMGGQHDVVTRQPVAMHLHAQRFVEELIGRALFVDAPAAFGNGARKTREIPPRMKSGLVRKPDAGAANDRHAGHEVGIEPKIGGELTLFLEAARLFRPRGAERRVQKSVHAFEVAGDTKCADGRFDLRDGRQTGVPDGTSVIAPEPLRQFGDGGVGDHRQVRRGVPGVDRRAAFALDDRHGLTGQRKQVGRSQTGDAAPHDDDINPFIPLHARIGHLRRRLDPVGRRVRNWTRIGAGRHVGSPLLGAGCFGARTLPRWGSGMAHLRVGTPVWLTRESPRRAPAYPSLEGRCEVDVAIVGGGMTGAGVAATFAQAGVAVAVVEGARAGRGSTGASTALLLQEPDKGLLDLGEWYGPRSAKRIWELSRDAARSLVKTIRRLELPCDLVERDAVYYTTKPEAALRAEYERRLQLSVASGKWLTPGPLRELTALPGRGAILTKGNAQFDPYKACVGLLHAASQAGALVFERSPVIRIEHTRNGVTVITRRGAIHARKVVIATGYATPGFQPLVGRFTMHHTYVLATAPMDARRRRELGLGDVMIWDTDRPYHYARWTPDQRLLFGGEDRPVVTGRQRAAAFTTATRNLRQHFESLLPALADIPIDHAWEGLFATTPDGLPYIGRHRRYPHHLFALGYGGNGMTLGFLAAKLLLEQWRGIESADHQLFGFGRLR